MKQIVIVICWLMPLLLNAQEKSILKVSSAANWQELLMEAKSVNKPILIDAYATWCLPCKKMDNEVFNTNIVTDFINQNFVFIRIQMDSTTNDNEHVKRWHEDGKNVSDYVTAYPAFLFFSSSGNYIGREIGYHDPEPFITLLKGKIDTKTGYMARIENFKRGKLNQEEMLELALDAKKNKDNYVSEISKLYKRKFIDNRPVDSLSNKLNKQFVAEFYEEFKTSDLLIKHYYKNPEVADKVFDRWSGYSRAVSDALISRDYIYNFILPNDQPITEPPKWDLYKKRIRKDFDKKTADRILLNARIFFAYKSENLKEVGRLELEKIDKYGLDTTAMGRAGINNLAYEIIFKHVTDTSLLRKAANHMKIVIETDMPKMTNYLDTYAGILYKIGDRDHAIEVEQEALNIAKKKKNNESNINFYARMIELMKRGEEIWKLE